MKALVRGLRALLSLVVLLGVVIGLPVALVRWGHWPITGVPTWDQVTELPLTIVTDTAIFGILTVAAWMVWAAFTASVVVELLASTRGRPGAELPWCGPLQRSARTLVASLVMSVSTTGSLATLPMAGVAYATPAVVTVEHHEPLVTAGDPAPSLGATEAPTALALPLHRVRQHDTWWGIAEEVLGDGLRWRELRDLNIGRSTPDGQVIGAGTDELLPSWTLVLPSDPGADGPTASSASAGPAASPTQEVTVVPGDSMWRIAERHLGEVLERPVSVAQVAEYCAAFVEQNRDRLVHRDNPDLIYPGQVFVLPAVPGRPPAPAKTDEAMTEPSPEVGSSGSVAGPPTSEPTTPPPTTSPPTTRPANGSEPAQPATPLPPPEPTTTSDRTGPTVTPSPPSTVGSGPDHQQEPSDDRTMPAEAMAVVASTALAVGVTWAVRRRRRRRSHLAPTTVPPPSPDEGLHRALVAAADGDSLAVLAGALGDLARALAEGGQRCRPRLVQHGLDHVDVLLDQPTIPAAEGWEEEADGAVWSRAVTTVVPSNEDALWTTPAPLLVTLGAHDESGQIYLDLEAAAVTTLTGDQECRNALARTMATELAHSPLAETAQVLVVGDLGLPDGVDLDRLTVVPDWDTAMADLSAWAAESQAALAAGGHPNPFIARAEPPGDDGLVPLLVIGTEPPDDREAFSFLHDHPATAAAVVLNDEPLPGSTAVECHRDKLWLPELRLTCVPELLDEDQLEGIADLFAAADDTSGAQLTLPVLDDESGGADDGDSGTVSDEDPLDDDTYKDPDFQVLVRFLGPITVEGHPGRPLTPKETAALAFIALRGSVSVDRVEDALWAAPSKRDHRRRLINIIGECRKVLGKGHLPAARDGNYTIGPGVMTDLELFDRRAQAAMTQHDETAATTLLGALELCRGPVFDYRQADSDSYAWVEAENLVGHWELKIANVACHLAERCLARGDPDTVVTACEIALRILPVHSHCTELLMEAHAANGHPHAVDRVYQSHVAALDLIHQDHPAESTVTLYHHLRPS